MTRRERVRAAIARAPLDRYPTQVNYTATTGMALADMLGVEPSSLPAALDNHVFRVDCDTRSQRADGVVYDMWAVGFSSESEGYVIAHHPMRDGEPEMYRWPDVEAPDLFGPVREAVAAEREGMDRFVVPNHGFSLFERAWSLAGFEEVLVGLHTEPDRIERLLEAITERQVILAQRYVKAGVDGGYFGDDLGTQSGMLFNPEVWRRLFKPRMARMFAVYRDAGLPVVLHSDGDISDILPDLIDIGLTCLNPCQPEVLDHEELASEYGHSIAFYGGVSTQQTLPLSTPEKVRGACESVLQVLGRGRTGLVFGPSHRLMSDIPQANLRELVGFVHEIGANHV